MAEVDERYTTKLEIEYLRKINVSSSAIKEILSEPDSDLADLVYTSLNTNWNPQSEHYQANMAKLSAVRLSAYGGMECPLCKSDDTFPENVRMSAGMDEADTTYLKCRNCGYRGRQ